MGQSDGAMLGTTPVRAVAEPWSTGFMPRAPERPVRVLVRMLGWALLGLFAVFVISFIIGAVAGFWQAATRSKDSPIAQSVFVIASACAMQGVFLWGALRRARITGWHGDIADGLGFYRPRRWGLLIALCVTILFLNGLWWLVRADTPAAQWTPGVPPLEAAFASAGITAQIMLALLAVLIAPVAEELFFRGWLWTALRLFWTPLPVMIVTGAAWIAVHMTDDVHSAIRLVPLAAMLGIARHFCRSVMATVGLHMCNNAVVAAAMFAFYG